MSQYYYFAGEGMPFYEVEYRSGRSMMPTVAHHRGAASMLGNADWMESDAPRDKKYPPLSDWPPVRSSGPEPLSPGEMAPWQRHPMEVGALSDMERSALGIIGLVALGYFAMKALKK